MQLNVCQTFAYPKIQITLRLHQGYIKIFLKFLLTFLEVAPKLPEIVCFCAQLIFAKKLCS